MNKAIIYGNLTRNPERKALPGGGTVATFGVATNRRVKRDDQWEDVPEFHNIVTFGKQADSAAQYLTKGMTALIEGRLQTRSWDKDGVRYYRTEIVAERVQFGPRKDSEKKAEATSAADDAIDYPAEDINPDDIPF